MAKSARKRVKQVEVQSAAPAEQRTLAEAVARMQERESRLTAILEAAADAIVTIDRHGVIESVNRACEQMFGYSAGELIGRNVNILMPSPYAEEHDRYIADYLRTGIKRIIGIGREAVARRKDGSMFPVDLTVSEVDHLQIFTGILRDVSERKQLAREILEIAHLEQRRLGADLHDVCGQEITAMALLASTLVESLGSRSPADADLARKITEGLKRVLQYVRDVARGLSDAQLSPADLPGALAELAGRLSEASKIKCTFEARTTTAVKDGIAATHLYHIAQEACTNALKHANSKKVVIQWSRRGGDLVLRVSDDGVGIPNSAREGLGLRIMRNRASVIGATLTVEKGSRGGTTVICTLPKERRHGPHQG